MIKSSQAAIAKAVAHQTALAALAAKSHTPKESDAQENLEAGAPLNPKLELASTATAARPAWKMPSLKGLTPREVVDALEGHSLNLEVKGVGLVRAQSPEPGQAIAEGDTVRLTLGEGE
jgi:hypothetical protein